MQRNVLFLFMLVLFMMLFSPAHASQTLDDSQLQFAKTTDSNGSVYLGLWQNGKPAVYGVIYNERLNYCYIGGFKDGLFHTNCAPPSILLEAVGTRYQGYFRDGQPVGGALYMTDNTKREMRMVEGVLTALATYKPVYDSESSHIVWDDYGKSFHLFKGYYEGESADIRSDVSKTHVVQYDNGDYFIGEMYQGMPLYGLYFYGSNGDFYYGSYEFTVTESDVIITGEKAQPYVEK